MQLDDVIDLVIPRGSKSLVSQIKATTKIPVLGHAGKLFFYSFNKNIIMLIIKLVPVILSDFSSTKFCFPILFRWYLPCLH